MMFIMIITIIIIIIIIIIIVIIIIIIMVIMMQWTKRYPEALEPINKNNKRLIQLPRWSSSLDIAVRARQAQPVVGSYRSQKCGGSLVTLSPYY